MVILFDKAKLLLCLHNQYLVNKDKFLSHTIYRNSKFTTLMEIQLVIKQEVTLVSETNHTQTSA